MTPPTLTRNLAVRCCLLATMAASHLPAVAESGPRHPLLAEKGRADERLLTAFSDREWLDLIPTQSPRKAAGSAPLGSKGLVIDRWEWHERQPNQLTCSATGEVYPSGSFPLQYLEVEVLSGTTVELPYVEGRRKERIWVQPYIDYRKFLFLERQLRALGASYAGTGDERYARIAALVLDAWADRIPDYFIGQGNPGLPPISPQEAERQLWFVCRVSTYNAMAHEWPHEALACFDCIWDSAALRELSGERRRDLRAHIAKDLFGSIGDVFAQRIKPAWAIRSNLPLPYMVLADAATILDRSDYIRYLDQVLEASMGENFKRDGMFPESFTYHRGYASTSAALAGRMSRFFALRPAADEALAAIKAKGDERLAVLERCATAHFPLCYPNGLIPPFGDSAAANDAPRSATRSALLPAYGHAALGGGTGPLQTQLNMGWGDFNNHCQEDVLGITLFAFGAELIANNRYDRGPARPFNNHALSHNTVLIDRESQSRRGEWGPYTSGNCTLYEPGADGIAVLEVDGSRSYADKASRYQRLVILNTVAVDHPYAIDLFAVSGGRIHDYLLHGATTFAETASLSFPLAPLDGAHPLLIPGETWQDPGRGAFPIYGMLLEASQGRSPGNWQAAFLGGGIGSRLFMVDDGASQVILARSPILGVGQGDQGREDAAADAAASARAKGGAPAGGEAPYDRQLRPTLLVRRQTSGNGPLCSLFVAVIEAVKGASAIAGVERLPLVEDDADGVALRIRFQDGRTDTVLVDLDNPAVAGCPGRDRTLATRDGASALHGRIGVQVATRQGREWAMMLGADRFRSGAQRLTRGCGTLSGRLVAAERRRDGAGADVLVADTELPAGEALEGRWMSVVLGACASGTGREWRNISEQFQIHRLERAGGATRIHTCGDHALTLAGGVLTEAMRPHRSFTGAHSFSIPLRATSGDRP